MQTRNNFVFGHFSRSGHYYHSEKFSGKSDTTKHLKTFRIIFNEMPEVNMKLTCFFKSMCPSYTG